MPPTGPGWSPGVSAAPVFTMRGEVAKGGAGIALTAPDRVRTPTDAIAWIGRLRDRLGAFAYLTLYQDGREIAS